MSENKRTEIGQLGEFGLIDRLSSEISIHHSETLRGIGDDAAVIAQNDGKLTLLSTDMLLEGIHFDLAYMPLQHLGYKAVAVNVSDIAAMNGIPKQITISIALSNRFSVEAVEVLYEGIRAAAKDYNVDIVGGDTTASRSGLVISVSVLGEATTQNVVYRSTANEGDVLCVTGDLGGAYMGLQVLERERQVFTANPDMQPDLGQYEYIVKRQLKPKARMDVIHELGEMHLVPTSMIDISDGLASEIFHLCKSSKLGVRLYEEKIPIAEETYKTAAEFGMDPNTCALNGGEDYELLFTIRREDLSKIEKHDDIQIIGYMQAEDKGKLVITRAQSEVTLKAQGWIHF